jgi:acetoin:2,6-dichlorophenolindophenol oxidoreductase subunit beta
MGIMTKAQNEGSIDFRIAVAQAIADEMRDDPSVLLLGEDVGVAGGVFQATRGLHAEFGNDRVIDTPISELALAGAAFGAAITGSRPIIEIMFGDFMFLAMDSLVNQSAKYWFLSDERRGVPLVVRSAIGAAGGFGAIHSQIPVPWLLGVAGLKIFAPTTPSDAYWMLRAAIRDDNPVVFLEHKALYGTKGELASVPSSVWGARVAREGRDVTLVGTMTMANECLKAAEVLAARGIEAEVIDLRVIRPMDVDTALDSANRTGSLLAVEEGPASGGWSADLLASVAERSIGGIGRLARLTGPNLPLPFAAPLERVWMPNAESIADKALAVMAHDVTSTAGVKR